MDFLTIFILGVIGIPTISADCAYNTNCARTENVVTNSLPPQNFRQAVRFGFDTPAVPLGPYHTPNCGCVTRGACNGEVGLYTRQVAQRSDLVCGTRFETCCYDGPYPGVADEFARAAACVPEEQCVRPYGILPTDVRDFGSIAPCPGRGVVRCLCLVGGVDQLEFKAALASIAAAQAQSQVSVDSAQLAPTHIDVPIVQSIQPVPTIGTQSAVSTYTSTSVGQGQTLAGTAATALTTSSAVPVQFPRPGGLFGSSSLAQSQVQLDSAQLAPPSAVHPVVQSIQPLNPTGPAHFTQINTQSPSGSTFTSVSTQSGVSTAPVVTPLEPVADAPAPVPATIPAPAPVPALLPRPAGLYGGPGLRGSPLFGGLGLGYGGGIGFRKHFSFTKGFGFGLGK